MLWRYSPQAKMLSLAAYERARRALREACELHSRGARVESNRTHRSKREGQPLRLSFSFWSKCGDSNSRPPVPETGALPTALHLEIFSFLAFCIIEMSFRAPCRAELHRRKSRAIVSIHSALLAPCFGRFRFAKTTISCF